MPTRRGVVLFVSGVVLVLAGRVLALSELTTVGLVLTVVVLVMTLLLWARFVWAKWLRLRVERRHPRANVFGGQPFTVTLVARGSRARLPLSIVTESVATGNDADNARHTGFGRVTQHRRKRTLSIGMCRTGPFPYRLVLPRGVHELGPGQISLVDPLGVARARFGKIPSTVVHVWPTSRMLSYSVVERLFTLSAANPESERGDLREYVVGDDLRHVHWPTSARADKLMVRNTQHARRTQRSNLLVADIRASSTISDFELVLSVTATLLYSLEPTDDVELVLVGASGITRSSGLHSAMDALCQAVPERAANMADDSVSEAFALGVVVANGDTQLPFGAQGPLIRCVGGQYKTNADSPDIELVVRSLDELETELDQLMHLSVRGG